MFHFVTSIIIVILSWYTILCHLSITLMMNYKSSLISLHKNNNSRDFIPNVFTGFLEEFPTSYPSGSNDSQRYWNSTSSHGTRYYAWVSMVTSGPSLVGLLLFSAILIHIIINKLRDILDLYLSVLLYATSQVIRRFKVTHLLKYLSLLLTLVAITVITTR